MSLVSEVNAPITAGVMAHSITNHGRMHITNQATASAPNETPPKLMFQVTNPIKGFTGREEFLDKLHDEIHKRRDQGSTISITITQTITGLGGIGKSETVRRYISKFSDEYDSIIWINAEEPPEAIIQFQSLASTNLNLVINGFNGQPRQFSHILDDIYKKLCHKPKLLLVVFDNAEPVDDSDKHTFTIRHFLPPQTITIRPPVVLITSRHQDWGDMNVIPLDLWEMEECIKFICERLKLEDTPENRKEATELAELFDRLPIAIEVATSVITKMARAKRISGSGTYGIKSLIAEYKAGNKKILETKTLQNSKSHVTMTFLLKVSLKKIKVHEDGKLAIKILAFMAYLSPTNIPKKMVHALLHETNEEERDKALILLADYSIIQSHDSQEFSFFSIHRVIQDIVIKILPSLQLQTVTMGDDSVYDTDELKILAELSDRLREYMLVIKSQSLNYYDDVVANIVHVTYYIIQNSRIQQFYTYIEKIADIIQKSHHDVSISFYNILIKYDRSKPELPFDKISQKLGIIATIYFENRKYENALKMFKEQLMQQANGIRKNTNEKQLNETTGNRKDVRLIEVDDYEVLLNKIYEDDPEIVRDYFQGDVVQTKMNIALCLGLQGKKKEEVQLYYKIQQNQEKALGSLHLEAIATKLNIAQRLRDQDKIDKTLELYFNTETTQKNIIGLPDQDTLGKNLALALSLRDQNRTDEALNQYFVVERGQDMILGPLHQDTLRTKLNIAHCLRDQSKTEEALKYFRIVVSGQKEVLGPLHPDTVKTKRHIDDCLKQLLLLTKEIAPTSSGTIISCAGTLYIGSNDIARFINNEPEAKLMFQVKNPINSFTGRQEFLEDLHDSIKKCRKEESTISILSQTITGLGGIGKSETVRMYIQQFGHEYDNIVWIDAERPSEAEFQLTALASNQLHINIKDRNGNPREFSHILSDIYAKLCQKPKQLLIVFDNAEALDNTDTRALGIRQFLPQYAINIVPPVVLITSRQQYWEDVNVITLGLWEMEECIEFIYKRLHLQDTPENKKDATELAELFDRLPFAIAAAVSAIAEQLRKRKAGGKGMYGINDLVADYKAGGRTVLRKRIRQNSTQVTMQLLLKVSLDKIKAYEDGQLAIEILAFMAYLSPTSIPKEMIKKLMHETDEDKLKRAFTLLVNYSIIQNYDTYFTIYRVFQDIVITIFPKLKLQEKKILPELIRRLAEYISVITQTHVDYNYVVTNVAHITDYIIQSSMVPQFYSYVQTFAHFVEEPYFETAIKSYRALIEYDRSHTDVPAENIYANLSSVGKILFDNGKYGEALETWNELLKMQEDAYSGMEHGKAKSENSTNAEMLSHNQNNDTRVELEKDQERVFGPLHSNTLATKMNIAMCLGNQGKYDEALELLSFVQKIQESVLGPLHPDSLKCRMNEACILSYLGRDEEALQINYVVEKNLETVLGPLHEDTLKTKMNIATCLSNLGRTDEAFELYSILEEDQEKVLGPLHPDSLLLKANKACTLSDVGENDEALSLFRIVENDLEKVLGPLHPTTLTTKMNFASCLSDQGKNEEALELYRIVEKNQEEALGPLHPDTLECKRNIASCLEKQDKV